MPDSNVSVGSLTKLLEMVGGRPIAFQPSYARIGGSIAAGLLLSQAMYWSERTNDPDGWFYKSQADWEDELGLTRREQEKSRRALTALGILEEKRVGLPARMYFRVDKERLADVLTGNHQPVSLDTALDIYRPILRGLSRAGHMRAARAGVAAEPVDYAEVLRQHGMTCGVCGDVILYGPGNKPEALSFDHEVPLSEGGPHSFSNLRPAHVRCNSGRAQNERTSSNQDRFPEADLSASRKHTGFLAASTPVGLSEADQSASDNQTGSLIPANHYKEDTEITPETTSETTPTAIGLAAGGAAEDGSSESAPDDEDGEPATPATTALMARFDRWYAAYPRKVQKQSAIKAWKQIKPNAGLTEQMILAVEAQKSGAQWLKDHGRFIPYPASWLRAGSWEDEIEQPAPAAVAPPPPGSGFRGMKFGFTPFPLLAESPHPLTAGQLARITEGAKLKDALTEAQFEFVRRAYAIHCRRYEYRVGEY